MNMVRDDAIPDADEVLLKLPAVRQMVALSHDQIYRRMRAGRFPRPVSLGPQSVAWRRSEILRWIAELPQRGPEHR